MRHEGTLCAAVEGHENTATSSTVRPAGVPDAGTLQAVQAIKVKLSAQSVRPVGQPPHARRHIEWQRHCCWGGGPSDIMAPATTSHYLPIMQRQQRLPQYPESLPYPRCSARSPPLPRPTPRPLGYTNKVRSALAGGGAARMPVHPATWPAAPQPQRGLRLISGSVLVIT